MTPSSNQFSKNVPSKSTNSFTSNMPTKSSNSFARTTLEKSDIYFSGDNTSQGDYSGDFATYGDIYGQGRYGGFAHFRNRTKYSVNHS